MDGLSMISEQNASIKMSSREIAELLKKDLIAILREEKWFEALQEKKLRLEDAALFSFCLSKEIQKLAIEIYDKALGLASDGKFPESRYLSDEIEQLKWLAASAESWFTQYKDLAVSFQSLRKSLFDIHCGLVMITLPNSNRQKCSGQKTYIVYNSKANQIKIGKSLHPKKRIRTLETQAGAVLDVLAIIDSDREYELHKKFNKYRTVGEWFDDRDGVIRQFTKTLN